MYMYKIRENPERQYITDVIRYNIGYTGELTIAKLKKYGVEPQDVFEVTFDDESGLYTLVITKRRLETLQECYERWCKEVEYNERYEEYHKNKSQKT